jgi:CRP-like cAMP-binding protein
VISPSFLAFFFLLPSRGERIAIAQRGQMFGELGLLGLTETGRRMRTAVSITECELLRMTKETFQVLILAQIRCKSLTGSLLSVLIFYFYLFLFL